MQLNDTALREQSIDKIRTALGSSDPEVVKAALAALNSIGELTLDKAAFRKAVERHLDSEDPTTANKAWWAVAQLGKQPGDLEHLQRVAWTGVLGDQTSILLFRFNDADLTGESGEIVRGLLDETDTNRSREAMRGIWGGKLSPALEEDIIALSRQPGFEHDAIYFALSTQANKSPQTIARLLETFSAPGQDGQRAAWGLQQGVASENAGPVADAAIQVASTRSSGQVLDYSWRLIDRYADRSQLDALRGLADQPGLAEDKRTHLQAVIRRIEAKPQ